MKNQYQERRFRDFREMLNASAETYGKRNAFCLRLSLGRYENITYVQLREHYYRLCSFFLRAGLLGKRIAVIGKNSYEWVLCYLCAATVGVAVPIDRELSEEDIGDFLDAANCAAVCTDGKKPSTSRPQSLMVNFKAAASLASGNKYEIGEYVGEDFPTDREAVDGIKLPIDKMQILIFTSGTTGKSKGVCLSQYNICSDVFYALSVIKVRPDDHTLSVLPLHHTYECTINCLTLLSKGACISYAESLGKISANIREYHPTVLVVVPELLKFLAKKIRKAVAEGCPAKYRTLFEEGDFADAMKKMPVLLRSAIRHKVRFTLGGKLRLFIVGAAELDPSIVYDFEALGIRTLQGYGLTECSPLLAANNDFYFNGDSVGVAIPGVTLRIDEPNEEGIGEILAKGDNIMIGYYNDPDATRAVFRGSWFCTGDLGRFGADGELYITGRKKNVIVTENGKNIYPEEIETRLSAYPEVAEVLVVPTKIHERVCVKAKILPNTEYLRESLGHMPDAVEIQASIRRIVDDMNDKIPGYKRVSTVDVLTEAMEKTTTRKIRRIGENVR